MKMFKIAIISLVILIVGINAFANKPKVIEVVIWESSDKYTKEEVIENAKYLNDFLDSQPGFLYRDLAMNEQDQWLDFLYWDSMESAKMAAEAVQQCELCQPFFDDIDMKSVKLYHFTSQLNHAK